MFNNRIVAIAAVLALMVPALGAAASYTYYNPVTERLVEGHTVFAVIEVRQDEAVREASFAAAVAVLVREQIAERVDKRFPGVLWFNDQYLVNPSSENANDVDYRYPCGGAVLAVNAGDDDPRVSLVNYEGETQTADGVVEEDFDQDSTYGSDAALVGVNPGASGSDLVYSDALTALNYRESYFITDPNDHSWVIDRYERYTRSGAAVSGPQTAYRTAGASIWVVNMLGSAVFLPDNGGDSCSPFHDLIADLGLGNNPSLRGAFYANSVASRYNGEPVYVDDPPAGYSEPSENGFCYNGVAATDSDADGIPDDCTAQQASPRLYNALLYFKLEHLTVNDGVVKDHADGSAGWTADTNGCQAGTEWACPGSPQDDSLEGNSHPFHPTAQTSTKEPCPAGFSGGGETTNHGGSTTTTYNCDTLHATRLIDLYFSPTWRPQSPVSRSFTITDTEGSTAPFHQESAQTHT